MLIKIDVPGTCSRFLALPCNASSVLVAADCAADNACVKTALWQRLSAAVADERAGRQLMLAAGNWAHEQTELTAVIRYRLYDAQVVTAERINTVLARW